MRAGWLLGSPLLLLAALAHAQSNPVPFLNQPLVPASTATGGAGFALTVNGTGFVSTSVVNWNGAVLPTKFVSASQLVATIPATDIANPATASITVSSPAPGGGTSNGDFFQVSAVTTPSFTMHAQPEAPSPSGQLYTSQVFVDVNGDGKIDAVGGASGEMALLLGKGDGSFESPQLINLGQNSAAQIDATVVGDFNHDGKLDFAFGNAMGNTVSAVLGNGDGTFGPPSLAMIATGNEVNYMAAGDFNHDGKLDLLTGNNAGFSDAATVSVLLGNGDGTFQSHVDYQVGNYLNTMVVGDLNGDGNLDLVTATSAGSAGPSLAVFLGSGNGGFGPPSVTSLGFQVNQVLLADVNGDSKLDLLTVDMEKPGHLYVFFGNGDGTFQSGVAYATLGDYPLDLTTGDFDADGKLDVASANSGSQTLAILFGNGDGTFQTAKTYPSSVTLGLPLFSADFNGDGKLDLFIQPNSSDDIAIVFLQGSFASATLVPIDLSFPQQAINSTSSAQGVTLTNNSGNAALTISSIAIGGSNAGDYAQTNNCGASLAANTSCQINVTFTPTALGTRNATLSISDNGPGSPQTASLTGVTPAASLLTLSPASLAFAGQYIGTSGLPQTVTATNTGTAALTISSVTSSASDFGVLNTCGSSLAAGASCSIGVFFDPTAAGARSGTLNVVDSASGGQPTVALSGMGQDFSFSGSGVQIPVQPGGTANFNIAVNPIAGFSQTVALSCTGVPAGSTCTLSVNSVALTGSSPAPLTVSVTTLGHSSLSKRPAGPWMPNMQIYFAICGLPGLWLFGGLGKLRKSRMWLAHGVVLTSLGCLAMAGCGGGNSGGGTGTTPPGTYEITVTGTYTHGSTPSTHSTTLTMIVE